MIALEVRYDERTDVARERSGNRTGLGQTAEKFSINLQDES